MRPPGANQPQDDSAVEQIADALRFLSLQATTAPEAAALLLACMICRRFPPEMSASSEAIALDAKVQKTLSALETLEQTALAHGLVVVHGTLMAVTTIWMAARSLAKRDQTWGGQPAAQPVSAASRNIPQRIAASLQRLSFEAETPLEAAALSLGYSMCWNLPAREPEPPEAGSACPVLVERLSALKFLEQEARRLHLETLASFLAATTTLWMSARYLEQLRKARAGRTSLRDVLMPEAVSVRH